MATITKVIPWSNEMYGAHTFRVFVEREGAPEPDREWMLEVWCASLAKPAAVLTKASSRFSAKEFRVQWTAGTGRRNSCLKSDIPMIKAALAAVEAECADMQAHYLNVTKGALYMCHVLAKARKQFYETELEIQIQRFAAADSGARERHGILTDVTMASDRMDSADEAHQTFWIAYNRAPLTRHDV